MQCFFSGKVHGMLYAARPLAATVDRDSKSHLGLIAIFHDEFVKTGRSDRERARALLRGYQRRQKSDYSDVVETSREVAESARDDSAGFLAECERLLKNR